MFRIQSDPVKSQTVGNDNEVQGVPMRALLAGARQKENATWSN